VERGRPAGRFSESAGQALRLRNHPYLKTGRNHAGGPLGKDAISRRDDESVEPLAHVPNVLAGIQESEVSPIDATPKY